MSQPDNSSTERMGETSNWVPSTGSRDLTGASLGDFQVERLLGRGGMGEVYLANQVSLNRPVALKVLRSDLLSKPTYLSRFEAEATAVAKLNHPNIVHIYTLGATDGIRFIAMEYVQGSNLREYIKKKGALDYALAFSIMRQAGVAVGAAGELGLVHRDIKPENLLLTRKGQVKIADFGLCRDLDAERVALTQTGLTMGTPLYMSPEQAQGHALDHRSDLYSLGVTFYHMLAGVPPFKADTALALALKHVKDTPVSIAIHRPDVPPEVDRLVLKLMAKDPADRYQSAAEMLRDLARMREAVSAPTGVQPLADLPGLAPSVPAPTVTTRGRNPAPAATKASPATSSPSAPASSGRSLGTMFLSAGAGAGAGRPWIGRRGGALLVAAGLAAGAGLGWLSRPEDLLSPRAAAGAEPSTLPGLWMEPRWSTVPKGASAEDQYLYAQIRAPRELQEAAWLAVPGHFPAGREWAARAYTQLARRLLLRRDADRLRVLGEEIDHWDGGQTHEKELANVIRTGDKVLREDLDGVIGDFEQREPSKMTDPALLGLALDVTTLAERVAHSPGSTGSNVLVLEKLRAIRQKLLNNLFRTGLRDPMFTRYRPG